MGVGFVAGNTDAQATRLALLSGFLDGSMAKDRCVVQRLQFGAIGGLRRSRVSLLGRKRVYRGGGSLWLGMVGTVSVECWCRGCSINYAMWTGRGHASFESKVCEVVGRDLAVLCC